jgi:hypothetical protein
VFLHIGLRVRESGWFSVRYGIHPFQNFFTAGSNNNCYDGLLLDSMSDLSSVKHLTAGTVDRPGERLMRPLDPLAASMPAGTGTIGVKPGKGQPTSSSSSSQVLPVRVGSVPKSTASKPEPQQVTTTEGRWEK